MTENYWRIYAAATVIWPDHVGYYGSHWVNPNYSISSKILLLVLPDFDGFNTMLLNLQWQCLKVIFIDWATKNHHCFMFNFFCFAPTCTCTFWWIQYITSIVLNFCITHMYWIHKNPPLMSLCYFDGFGTDPICALKEILVDLVLQPFLPPKKNWDFSWYGTVSSQNDYGGYG